ncbi:hypothetical protein AIOL_004148 [Candidatus Rhodobacter oscarellae]|uniref:Uncharacterized protein n=1 Tax=Candidatus Rhodobacter oscarellae TaxID=1675527 RepID=A0A0J9E8R7_9RHOB|nr:hypothetical protein AIOL_004148 [Candidatus Rhodobacter lobularis]
MGSVLSWTGSPEFQGAGGVDANHFGPPTPAKQYRRADIQ